MKLIDANALMDVYRRVDYNSPGAWSLRDILNFIEIAPTVDAVEVKHGRWEKHGKHDWRCSACKVGVPYSYTGNHYCHNCGAKMDGDGNG